MAGSQRPREVGDGQHASHVDRDSTFSRATPVIAVPNWSVHGASTKRYRPEDLRAAAAALGVAEQQLHHSPFGPVLAEPFEREPSATDAPHEAPRRSSSPRLPVPSSRRVTLAKSMFAAIFCAVLVLLGYEAWINAQDVDWARRWVDQLRTHSALRR